VAVVVLVCLPDKVVIDGGGSGDSSDDSDNSTTSETPQYQRSRQFKLRAVLYSPCDDEDSLLLPTTVQWTAEPHGITFSSTNKELIVVSNSLEYGVYSINVVVVSLLSDTN